MEKHGSPQQPRKSWENPILLHLDPYHSSGMALFFHWDGPHQWRLPGSEISDYVWDPSSPPPASATNLHTLMAHLEEARGSGSVEAKPLPTSPPFCRGSQRMLPPAGQNFAKMDLGWCVSLMYDFDGDLLVWISLIWFLSDLGGM